MKSVVIFDFENYKEFLMAWIKSQPHKGRGLKLAMSEAMECQTAYVSQVLLGNSHLSLEQAEKLSEFLKLTDEETRFLFLLVQCNRAGTPNLKRKLKSQITSILEERRFLKNRVKADFQLSEEIQAHYFSNWKYSALHALVSIPEFQTREAISQRLSIHQNSLEDALQFLVQNGLIEFNGSKYQSGSVRIHLPHDSVHINQHHSNWRMEAIRSLESKMDTHLHYSSVISVSGEDSQKIKEKILQMIEQIKPVIRDSKEEKMFSLCLDFFEPRLK